MNEPSKLTEQVRQVSSQIMGMSNRLQPAAVVNGVLSSLHSLGELCRDQAPQSFNDAVASALRELADFWETGKKPSETESFHGVTRRGQGPEEPS